MADRESISISGLTSRQRRELFLDLAGQQSGVSVSEVYAKAIELGDTATEEAYHNIARRLVHSWQAVMDLSGERARYSRGGERWLDEDELADLVDPDYPILALTIWKEAVQQVNNVPESVWAELRARLEGENARELFLQAIVSYSEDFEAAVRLSAESEIRPAAESERAHIRKEAENCHQLLLRLTKYGLGLSQEAVALPETIARALSQHRAGELPIRVDVTLLREELARRVEDTSFVRQLEDETVRMDPAGTDRMLVGGVDGSSRGGLLSVAGQDGDFHVAHAPLVSINTAVGQINRQIKFGGRVQAAFVRLPERPEDMQRQDNRHTVMAKLLHPDLTDAQYMHSVWNAMDLVETKVTKRLLRRWYTNVQGVEVPPADVVLRDGSASPQDRDFSHYKEQNSYGQIVRDLVENSWEVALICREDRRSVCGVVKQTQLSVYGPVLNWYAARIAAGGKSQIAAWPLRSMNLASDQLLITRLLTAGRKKGDPWTRTCAVVRPFHAVTNYASTYRRADPPVQRILREFERVSMDSDTDAQYERAFWMNFQGEHDPYLKMLGSVQYASVFVAPVPRLDNDNMLPRLEILTVAPTDERAASPWGAISLAVQSSLKAIRLVGFDVAAEHSMFTTERRIDILPRLLITTHEIVKTWALELVGRVQEYVGYHLARYVKGKKLRGVHVRPFTRAELEALYAHLKEGRERQAGGRSLNP